MILCPFVLNVISEKRFGGINGDVVGAANEITRALVIVALALV
jgi:adenosylcobinamide-GDP ribazoletransferase